MRSSVRTVVDRVITPVCQRLGILNLARRALHRRSLTVVMFHRVLPLNSDACRHAEREYVVGTDEFDRCLTFFGRHYSVVTLAQVERAAARGEALPPHPLLITFDDGWRDNVAYAEPILRRHGMKATLFVNIDAVRQSGLRWWQDALVEAAQAVQAAPAAPAAAAVRPDFFTTLAITLKRPLEERLPAVLPATDYVPGSRQMLTVDEVSRLDDAVWDVGSHGITHSPLTHVSDPERELQDSFQLLSAWKREPVRAVSMPHGRYSEGIVRVARAVYSLVFTSDPFLTMARSACLQSPIGRIHVPSSACADDGTLARFLWIRRQR